MPNADLQLAGQLASRKQPSDRPGPRRPPGYGEWLAELKDTIRQARLRASLAANAELIGLYWRIGRDILDRQQRGGWGSKVVERLAADLRAEFPDMRGLSRANLLYMRAFAEAWPDPAARLWYAEATLEHGWSRPVLATQVETGLRERQGRAITNFGRALPPADSDLAQQILDVLLEVGKGFAFVGSQHRLEVGGQDWYVDLLF